MFIVIHGVSVPVNDF